MSLFARRIVQRELEFLQQRGVLRPAQRSQIVSRLDSGHPRDTIAAEWEVVVVSAFSRQAHVRYEEKFGSKHPDVLVRFHEPTSAGAEFLAEIVSVSDDTADLENPIDYLWAEFDRIAFNMGLGNGGFKIRVGNCITGTFPERRTKLLLPPKGDVTAFLKQHVIPFLREVKRDPADIHNFEWLASDVEVRIGYDPKRLGHNTGGFAGYSSPMSLRSNVLFRALNDKASDLRETGYPGIKGILVVDAGCRALSCPDRRGGSPWGRGEIIEEFLRCHNAVDFVTTTRYENRTWATPPHVLRHHVYWRRPFDQQRIDLLNPVISASLKSLPRATRSPDNAKAIVHAGRQIAVGSETGRYEWTPRNRLAVSSRVFVSLLAGTISQSEFRLMFVERFPNRGPFFSFFRHVLESRATLKGIQIILQPDKDDDLIVFDLNQEFPMPSFGPDFVTYDLAITDLLDYFGRLTYEVLTDEQKYSIGTAPAPVQEFLRQQMAAGRMLVGARISDNRSACLQFGPRDAAVSDFW